MLDPGEPESQAVALPHDPLSDSTNPNGDDPVPDSNILDEDHNTLISRVEDTQFVNLQHDSQTQENSFYRPIVRTEPTFADDMTVGFKFAPPAKPVVGRFSVGIQQRETIVQRNIDRATDPIPIQQNISLIHNEAPQPPALAAGLEPRSMPNPVIGVDQGIISEDNGFNQRKIGYPVVAWKSKGKQHSFSEVGCNQISKARRLPFPEVATVGQSDENIETPARRPSNLVNLDNRARPLPNYLNPLLDMPLGVSQSGKASGIVRNQTSLLEPSSAPSPASSPNHVPNPVEPTNLLSKASETASRQDEDSVGRGRPSGNLSGHHYPVFNSTHNSPSLYKFPSQSPPGTQSRPRSASNISAPMTRPLNPRDLLPHSSTNSPVLHATKVAKSAGKNQAAHPNTAVGKPTYWNEERAKIIARYPSFLEEVMKFKTIAEDYYAKDAFIESQRKQIEELKNSEAGLKNRSESLKAENLALQQKTQKCKDLSSKYKEHMNKVVQCQEILGSQAKEMRKISSQAIATYTEHGDTYDRHESVAKKITEALKDIKEKRLEIDKSVADEKDLLLRSQKSVEETKNMLEQVSTEKKHLSVTLQDSLKTNDLLRADLQKNLLELSRERHYSEQLHNQLSVQLAVRQELVEQFKKVPVDVVSQLTEDGGVLTRILNSDSMTQAKLGKLITVLDDLKNHEPEPPCSLVMLIQDISKRISDEVQFLGNDETFRQELIFKQFEDLKELLHQLQADSQDQSALNHQISELRESNIALTTDKSTLEQEIQRLAWQLNEVRGDLNSCRDQLAEKSQELATHIALPREDPRHIAKIQELESLNSSFQDQLDSVVQQKSKIEQELRLIQDELQEAKNQVEPSAKENKELQIALTTDAEHAKRAQMVGDEKMLKLSSTTRNLRELCKDKDAQLKEANEALQSVRNENVLLAGTAERNESQKALLEEQMLKVIESQERLELQHQDSDTQQRIVELESIRDEFRKITPQFAETIKRADEDIRALFTVHAKFGDDIRKSEEENILLRTQISELQGESNQVQNPPRSINIVQSDRYTGQVGLIQPRSQRKMLTNMPPPIVPKQNVVETLRLPPNPQSPQAQVHEENYTILKPHFLRAGPTPYPSLKRRTLHSDLGSHQGLLYPTSAPQLTTETRNLKQYSLQGETFDTQALHDTQQLPGPNSNWQPQQDLQPKPSARRVSNRKSVSSRSIYQSRNEAVTTWEGPASQITSQQQIATVQQEQSSSRDQINTPSTSPIKDRRTISSYNYVEIGQFNRSREEGVVQSSPRNQTLPPATQTTPSLIPFSTTGSVVSTLSPLSDLEDRIYDLERMDENNFEDECNKRDSNGHPKSKRKSTAASKIPESPGASSFVQNTYSTSERSTISLPRAPKACGDTGVSQAKQGKLSEPNHRQNAKLKSALKNVPTGLAVNEQSGNEVQGPREITELQIMQPNPMLQNGTIGQIASKGQTRIQAKAGNVRSYKRVVEGKPNTPMENYAYPEIPRQSPMAGVPRRNRSIRAKRQLDIGASERPSKVPRISLPHGGLGLHRS